MFFVVVQKSALDLLIFTETQYISITNYFAFAPIRVQHLDALEMV